MKIFVREHLHVQTKNEEIVKTLKSHLTRQNPEYQKLKALGYAAYNVPRNYRMYSEREDGIIIPRGTGSMARGLAKKHGELCAVVDERTVGKELDIRLAAEITPYWYQAGALEALTKHQQGMLEAPCATGKTVIGCMLMAQERRPTLVVVHTLDLFKQWLGELGHIISGKYTIGQFGGGKKKHGNITIATVQTLSKLDDEAWLKFKNTYGITIMDEAHHCGADTYIKVMKNLKSKYLVGLTATPKRNDGKNFIVSAYLGEIVHKITPADLEVSGRLVSCDVRVVKTGRRYNFTRMGDNYTKLANAYSKDIKRNEVIAACALQDVEEGRIPILLTERVMHAKYLVSLLAIKGVDVEEISGHVPPYERDRIRKAVKAGKIQALVANKQIAAEGLDAPSIDSVHVCFFTKNLGLFKQMIGRGRRVFGDKETCRVWIYEDSVYREELDDITFEPRAVPAYSFSKAIGTFTKWCNTQGFDVDGDFNVN